MLHYKLADSFGCSATFGSPCICNDILLEQLISTIHSSGLWSKFSNFVSVLENSSGLSKDDFCRPVPQSHSAIIMLRSFFDLCIQLNTTIAETLCTICEVFSLDELHTASPELQDEIHSIVSSIVIPPHTRDQVDLLLYVYLCLELEAAELECDQYNVFSSVLTVEQCEAKQRLLHLGRQLNLPRQPFTLSPCCKQLFVPYAKTALTHRIKLLCAQSYSEHFLDPLLKYKNAIMKKFWLLNVFSGESKHEQRILASQLPDELVYQLFYEVRKPDLFSLIIEFPDSMAALQDLGKCLDHVSFRHDLITHLTECIRRRLLHPGVHTEQILVAYGYLVRALRLIDKSSLVQDVVCRPVSKCLRQRDDAVHCIMDKLLYTPEQEIDGEAHANPEDPSATSTELYSELLSRKPLEVASVDGTEDSDAEFVFEDPAYDEDVSTVGRTTGHSGSNEGWGSNWQPDPVEAMYQGGLWRRRLDLLSMLVSIYGSKKAFLVEYKQLLSQRLLRQRSFHTARELRNLELLKLRFGEQNLVECEVMLKDIRDSKRVAALVSESMQRTPTRSSNVLLPTKSESSQARGRAGDPPTNENTEHPVATFPLSAYILSAHYWPELLNDRFKLPEGLRTTFDAYERSFQKFKGNRTLQWMHKLGLVNIELELGDRKVQMDVTPLQASIGYLFTTRRTWSLRDLAQDLETQVSTVRQALHIFVQSGFIHQCPTPEASSDVRAELFEVCDASSGYNSRGAMYDLESSADKTDRSCQLPSSERYFSNQDSEMDAVVSSVRERREKELQVFWSYIVAMLTNLGGLTLSRIHSMLRMFAMGSTSGLDCTREELKQFLDKKLHQSELAFDGETYTLFKPDS
ncbi:unnamed protein product [Dicrocoelium dendriticum]|nr:unnamed protein product [Dicrocoelium dendriticum]